MRLPWSLCALTPVKTSGDYVHIAGVYGTGRGDRGDSVTAVPTEQTAVPS